MELRYEIAEEQLRVFVAALHCLAHVGKEISLECEGTSALTCRALNDAHSASGQIALDRSFFADVRLHHSTTSRAATDLARFVPFVKCKVYAKSCCNIFRTLKHVRSVQLVFRLDEQAALADLEQLASGSSRAGNGDHGDDDADELDMDCVELVWRLRCDFDVTKTHRMKVHTCQVMRAVFDRERCANRLVTRQHHLTSLLGHIHQSTEVCVTCSPTHVKFESYAASGTESTSVGVDKSVDGCEWRLMGVEDSRACRGTDRQSAAPHRDCSRERRVQRVHARSELAGARSVCAAHLYAQGSARTSRWLETRALLAIVVTLDKAHSH